MPAIFFGRVMRTQDTDPSTVLAGSKTAEIRALIDKGEFGPALAVAESLSHHMMPHAVQATLMRCTLKAVTAGDVRFKVSLTSTHLTTPVSKEESTRVYGE